MMPQDGRATGLQQVDMLSDGAASAVNAKMNL
jgi:hypothetical protein